MYKVKNIAFEPIFAKYGVKSLEELSDEKVTEVCHSMGSHVRKYRRSGMDEIQVLEQPTRFERIKQLIKDCSLSTYMGTDYWTADIKERAKQFGINVDKLNKATTGQEVFSMMADLKVGLNGLEPGQSVECDFTKEWIKEVLVRTPIINRVEIIDLNTNMRISRGVEAADGTLAEITIKEEPVKLTELPKEPMIDLRMMSYQVLRAMCTDLKINIKGMKKEQMIDALARKQYGIEEPKTELPELSAEEIIEEMGIGGKS